MSKKFDKLIKLLKELFQLDRPDLDFGLYRIMHSKSEEISNFLENDLFAYVEEAFGEAAQLKAEDLKQDYEKRKTEAYEYGIPEKEIETSPKVREALIAYEAALETDDAEDEIYDHLYRFFERYYDSGDFMSLRYFTRETADKAHAYAIPYDGSDLKEKAKIEKHDLLLLDDFGLQLLDTENRLSLLEIIDDRSGITVVLIPETSGVLYSEIPGVL